MTSFILKMFACISMFIDHVKYILPLNGITFNLFTYIGRFAFPIFAFQLAEGYFHTNNLKKYFFRLLLLAIISQIPFALYFKTQDLNIFFTLFLGLLAITTYDKMPNKLISIPFIGMILYIAYYFQVDYSYYGVLIILIFAIGKKHKFILSLSIISLTFIFYYITNHLAANTHTFLVCIFTILALFPIFTYNGKQGKKVKYLFYLFYPIHILLLYLCSFL